MKEIKRKVFVTYYLNTIRTFVILRAIKFT